MMYAFFPGCVSRGGCPELYPSAVSVCQRFNIELVELTGASCTGAGVLQEKNQKENAEGYIFKYKFSDQNYNSNTVKQEMLALLYQNSVLHRVN